MSFTVWKILLLVIVHVHYTFACNGYVIKVNHIANCGSQNVISIENFNVSLDKACNIVPKGCVSITKPFKTLNVHYTISKPPMPDLTGVTDLCKLTQTNQAANDALTIFALPTRCPVIARNTCTDGNKKISIGKYKTQLGYFSGNIKIKAQARHDSGNTCVDVDFTLTNR